MPSLDNYPVRGVDVSAHQGQIQWEVLSRQDITFAFIKATEGSSWVDKHFAYNFQQALDEGLYVGAYHFFSFDSSGERQAAHFITNVPLIKMGKILPPVVDLEFYGNKASNPPQAELFHNELKTYLSIIESHYGVKPIIYTTPSFYDKYLRGHYVEYPLWIRSVFFAPHSFFARCFNVYFSKDKWLFWQYNPKGILKGYTGGEKYIDLNVFNGDENALQIWLKHIESAH